jgi:Bacterial Ig domain/Cadherin-like domain
MPAHSTVEIIMTMKFYGFLAIFSIISSFHPSGTFSSFAQKPIEPQKKLQNSAPSSKSIKLELIAIDRTYSVQAGKELLVNKDEGILGKSKIGSYPEVRIQPTKGKLVLNRDGSFTYKPDDKFSGEDQFSYVVRNAKNTSKEAKVKISVISQPIVPPPELPKSPPLKSEVVPNATDDSFSVSSCYALQKNSSEGLLSNDSYNRENASLKIGIVSPPKSGKLEVKYDGSFSYLPNTNLSGEDKFTYIIEDGSKKSNEATVKINIAADSNVNPPEVLDKNYLILGAGKIWRSKRNDSEPYALNFQKGGKLVIHYRYSAGTFTRDAKYKVADRGRCPSLLDIDMGDGKLLKTIFRIETKSSAKTLSIELVDLRFGQARPSDITDYGAKHFQDSLNN